LRETEDIEEAELVDPSLLPVCCWFIALPTIVSLTGDDLLISGTCEDATPASALSASLMAAAKSALLSPGDVDAVASEK